MLCWCGQVNGAGAGLEERGGLANLAGRGKIIFQFHTVGGEGRRKESHTLYLAVLVKVECNFQRTLYMKNIVHFIVYANIIPNICRISHV